MKRDLPTLVIGASLALILMYFGVVGYLWRQGLFDIPDTESGARVLAAVLALLGGLFAALLTFAGVLLKHSIDERNLALQKEIADRLKLEGEEAEERLKLDTFIRAAGLLATDAGTPAPKTQQAAALFALADLNHLRFMLALLREMWPAGAISPTSACWLVNECLLGEDANIQMEAAGILKENAKSLTASAECMDFPEVASGSWPTSLPLYAAQSVLVALFRAIHSRPARKWSTLCLNGAALTLVEAIRNEEDAGVRHMARLLLNILLTRPPVKPNKVLLLPNEKLDLAKISSKTDLEEAKRDAPVQGLEMANQLEEWAKGTEPEPSASGAPDPGTTS